GHRSALPLRVRVPHPHPSPPHALRPRRSLIQVAAEPDRPQPSAVGAGGLLPLVLAVHPKLVGRRTIAVQADVIPDDVPAPVEQVAGTRSTRATDVKFVVIPSVVRPLAVYFTPIAILEVEAESAVHPAPDHAYVQQLEGLPVVLDSAVERKMRIEAQRRLDPDLADRPGRSQVDPPADGVLHQARPRRVVVAHGRLAVVADRRIE